MFPRTVLLVQPFPPPLYASMRTLLNTTGTANISPCYARVASGSSLFFFLPHPHGTPAHRFTLEMRMYTYERSPRLCTQVQYCARKWHPARVLLSVIVYAQRGLWIPVLRNTVHPSRQEYHGVVDVFGAVTTLNHWSWCGCQRPHHGRLVTTALCNAP
jgi:hypothetical protein